MLEELYDLDEEVKKGREKMLEYFWTGAVVLFVATPWLALGHWIVNVIVNWPE